VDTAAGSERPERFEDVPRRRLLDLDAAHTRPQLHGTEVADVPVTSRAADAFAQPLARQPALLDVEDLGPGSELGQGA
jgi:hypothetical protein